MWPEPPITTTRISGAPPALPPTASSANIVPMHHRKGGGGSLKIRYMLPLERSDIGGPQVGSAERYTGHPGCDSPAGRSQTIRLLSRGLRRTGVRAHPPAAGRPHREGRGDRLAGSSRKACRSRPWYPRDCRGCRTQFRPATRPCQGCWGRRLRDRRGRRASLRKAARTRFR